MLSVVIRFHDIDKWHILTDAVFSLCCQTYRPIEAVLVCQNLPDDGLEYLQSVLRPYGQLIPLRIVNVPTGAGDHRTRLINEGIAAAAGRYISFLDYDDIVYPEGYSELISFLEKNDEFAFAIGNAQTSQATVINGATYLDSKSLRDSSKTVADLCEENFAPIVSYLIDRERLPDTFELKVDVSFEVLEDYSLLLNLLSSVRGAAPMGIVVGEWRQRPAHSIEQSQRSYGTLIASTYSRMAVKIEDFKNTHAMSLKLSEVAALKAHWSRPAPAVPVDVAPLEREVVAARQALLAVASYALTDVQWDEVPVWPHGHLEEHRIVAGDHQIAGWIVDGSGQPFSGQLVCFGADRINPVVVTDERRDVFAIYDVLVAGFKTRFASLTEAPIEMLVFSSGRLFRLPVPVAVY